MLALDSCVQGALAPGIDAALARVLDRIGISLLRVAGGGCCGALPHHLSGEARALAIVRRNIDAWWPHVDRDVEAIVVTASGCGVMVKDYGHLLRDDRAYAEKAKRISALARDPVEVIGGRVAAHRAADRDGPRRAEGRVPVAVLAAARHEAQGARRGDPAGARPRADAGGRRPPLLRLGGHVLDPAAGALARAQGAASSKALEAGRPDVIATANIGCLAHLADGAQRPVRHWIELLDARMLGGERAPS